MKIFLIFAFGFTATTSSAMASDCRSLGRELEQATVECETKIPADDLDAYSACFNAEVTRRTGLSVREVEEKLAKCKGR